MNCKTCAFSNKDYSKGDKFLLHGTIYDEPEECERGRDGYSCRFHPPTFTTGDHGFCWPEVGADDWCGRYEEVKTGDIPL